MYKNSPESRNPAYLESFDFKEKQKEAIALQEEQDAEVMLYQYIINSACRSETPLSISKTMATYLGKAQFLPAGKVLAAVTPMDTHSDPMHNLMRLNEALAETPIDLGDSSEQDAPQGGHSWISLHTPEMSIEDRINRITQEAWREPADPLLRHNPTAKHAQPMKGMRIFRFISLVILGVFIVAAAENYGCVPEFMRTPLFGIPASIKQDEPEASPSTAPANLSAPLEPKTLPENSHGTNLEPSSLLSPLLAPAGNSTTKTSPEGLQQRFPAKKPAPGAPEKPIAE